METSLLSSGLQGISRSREGLDQSARTIASGGQSIPNQEALNSNPSSGNEVLSAVVDLNLYEVSFKASAKVLETADETVGTLLDEFV